MERFVKGDVVITDFPFSDLSKSKRRPAFVIKDLVGNDLMLAQITSKFVFDSYSIRVIDADFEDGSLKQDSFVRPNRLFTADQKIILYKIGKLNKPKIEQIVNKIIEIIKS